MRHLFRIELPLWQDWEAIDPLRQSVIACLKSVFHDHDTCDALAMVAGELLENAIKFGAREPGQDHGFMLSVRGGPAGVEIEVANPVNPASPDLQRLLAELTRISHAASPQEAYLAAVRRVALGSGKTGLGLSRVAHEGGCDLTARLDVDGLLRVRAVTRSLEPVVPTPAPPA